MIQYIDGAGHWAHADKPQEFIEIVKQSLLSYGLNEHNIGTDSSL